MRREAESGGVLFELGTLDAILSELCEQFKRGQSIVRTDKVPGKQLRIRRLSLSGFWKRGAKHRSRLTRKHLPTVACSYSIMAADRKQLKFELVVPGPFAAQIG